MRIIIEEYKYAAADVKDVLKGIDALENVEGYVSVNYVGYFYNTDKDVRDCVFILPKVLLEDVDGKELVFGKYAPEDIINLDAHNPLTQPEKDFIYEFAVWIYRAIVVFHNDKRNKTSIVYHKKIAEIGKESVYKQFTYARNVIQWNLNLFMNDDRDDEELQYDKKNFGNVPKLRDDVTEGYNVIPNFFISAKLNKELSYKDEVEITDKKNTHFSNSHFENRLFDRDTLLICHYDVNFLYVVSLYARNNSLQKEAWKRKVRENFRSEIQRMLTEQYSFYAMQAHPNIDAKNYLKEHFQQTLGKIFTPFGNDEVFSLALDKKDPEGNNDELLSELRKHFFVIENGIGENPEPTLSEIIEKEGDKYKVQQIVGQKCLIFNLLGDQYTNSDVKLATDQRFGIAIQSEEGHNVLHLEEGMTSIAYLVITNKKECKVYNVEKNPMFLTGQDCRGMLTTKKDALVYLVFKVSIPHEDVSRVMSNMVDMEKVRTLFGYGHGIKMLDFNSILKNE